MSKNHYADAMRVLFRLAHDDYRRLLEEIAIRQPSAVSTAAAAIGMLGNGKHWSAECSDLWRSGRKVEAIKLCRKMTGASLVEAKKYVEGLA